MEWVSTRFLEAKALMKESGGMEKRMVSANLQAQLVKRYVKSLQIFIAHSLMFVSQINFFRLKEYGTTVLLSPHLPQLLLVKLLWRQKTLMMTASMTVRWAAAATAATWMARLALNMTPVDRLRQKDLRFRHHQHLQSPYTT